MTNLVMWPFELKLLYHNETKLIPGFCHIYTSS